MAGHSSFTNRLDPNLLETETSTFGSRINQGSGQTSDNMVLQRASGYSLDLLSDAAHHLASDHYKNDLFSRSLPTASQEALRPEPARETSSYEVGLDEDTTMKNTDPSLSQPAPLEDYNLFLDDSGLNSNFFSAFDTNIPVSFWSKPAMTESSGQFDDSRLSTFDSQDERSSFS
jgi:hypothetical protein